ncbi:EpsG family protein [Pedobacter sp. NJ-S-72]
MLFYITYIVIISILLLSNYFIDSKYNFFEITGLVIIILVSGLRDYTGYDFKSYTDSYQSAYFDYKYEPGFRLLMQTLRFFGADSHVMFFLFSLSTFIILCMRV